MGVGQHELEGDVGPGLAELGQDRREDLGPDDLAGRHSHHAAHRLGVAGGDSRQRSGRRGHGAGMRLQQAGGPGGGKTAGGAGEQVFAAEGLLQRLDLPADRRLGQSQPPRRAGEAAGVDHRQEGAVEGPVGLGHAGMYINPANYDNSA